MSEYEKRYPGNFSGEQIDELLHTVSENGKTLKVTVNGEVTEYNGTENKTVNIDTKSSLDNHNTDSSSHSDIRQSISAKYTKPASGIPVSDLSNSAQTAITAAGTALQHGDIDGTLSISGKAADAKAVGDALVKISESVSPIIVPVKTWEDVRNIVRSGRVGDVFHIGDQLVCKKGDDTLVWDIIGIDHDTPADPQFTHSLTLQLHDCLKTNNMQFDAPEAFYYCETELPAGTYHFMINSSYGGAQNDFSAYQFTLANPVPVGGQLTFPWGSGTNASATKVSSYTDAASTSAIETVSVTNGTGGKGLGTLTTSGDFENNLNAIHRVRYGSSNYKESPIRQFLNSDSDAGSVWTPQTKFDRPPTWAANTAGFINALDSDFFAVIGKTHIKAARNTVCDGGGYDEMDDGFFLLSRSEVYGGNEQNSVSEGEPYPYYSDYSDLSAAGTGEDSNRVKYRLGTKNHWWLRTPRVDYGHSERNIDPTGAIPDHSALNTSGIAPACNII